MTTIEQILNNIKLIYDRQKTITNIITSIHQDETQAIQIYDNVLYHGTSSMYIDEIMKNGLTGRYPDDKYNQIKNIWSRIRNYNFQSKAHTYLPDFFQRQDEIRKNPTNVQLSFTRNLDVAKQFASGERNMGEGPGYFADYLKMYMLDKNVHPMDKFTYHDLNNYFIKGKQCPGIILAIKKDEIIDRLPNEFSKSSFASSSGDYEQTIYLSIKPEELYVYINGDLEKILSDKGKSYIDTLKKQCDDPSKKPQSATKKYTFSGEYVVPKPNWVYNVSVYDNGELIAVVGFSSGNTNGALYYQIPYEERSNYDSNNLRTLAKNYAQNRNIF